MLQCNEAAMVKFPELFIKNIPVRAGTAYRLTFEQLGGSIGVWVNRCFAEKGAKSHHFSACNEWTTREVVFTTGTRLSKMESFRNWGVAFFKKNESMYMCGLEDTYVANVQLTTMDAPQLPLLREDDFPISHTHITHTDDPLDRTRHCLLFRSLMAHPPHPADVPLQVRTFGCIKEPLFRITRRHPYGVPYHCFVFAACGLVYLENESIRINSEEVLYIPPNTPFCYTFERRETARYYWVEFSGSAAESFLSELPIPPFAPIPLRHLSPLSTHIEQMLQQPYGSPLYPYIVSSHLQLLLTELRQQLCVENDDEQRRRIEAVAAQLRESPLLPSNEELAAENGFSTGHFIRIFKSYIGCTPHRYALQCRLEKARELLKSTPLTVREVAYAVGFEDPQYFSRLFRADTGMSPREYRQR